MEDERGAYPLAGAAALEHLTGPSRGTVTWLSGPTLDISLRTNRFLRVSEARPDEPRDDLVARLHRAEDTYEIEALEGRPVWVNGVRVTPRPKGSLNPTCALRIIGAISTWIQF